MNEIILQGQYEKKYKNGDAYFAVIATSAFSPKTSFVHVRVTKQQWEELNTKQLRSTLGITGYIYHSNVLTTQLHINGIRLLNQFPSYPNLLNSAYQDLNSANIAGEVKTVEILGKNRMLLKIKTERGMVNVIVFCTFGVYVGDFVHVVASVQSYFQNLKAQLHKHKQSVVALDIHKEKNVFSKKDISFLS